MSIEEKELGKKLDKFKALWEVNQAITSTLKINRLLALIIDAVVKIMQADAVTIRLLSKDKKKLMLKVGRGIIRQHFLKGSIGVGDGIAGEALERKEPMISEDVFRDKRYAKFFWMRKEKLHSLICVPLLFKERKIGVLSVYNKKPFFYKKENGETLTMFANQASIALEHARLFEELRKNYLSSIKALATVVELKDKYTRGHCEKVSRYSVLIARKLGFSKKRQETIRYAAYLHDIGKVAVSADILRKSGPLNDREWTEMRQHPVDGSKIVKQLSFLKNIVPVILYHHERWDGKGYPEGKDDGKIPLGARILAVADAFDAMTSNRPYRDALPKKKAIEELKDNKGTQFDPVVVDAFLEILAKKKKRGQK